MKQVLMYLFIEKTRSYDDNKFDYRPSPFAICSLVAATFLTFVLLVQIHCAIENKRDRIVQVKAIEALKENVELKIDFKDLKGILR